MDEWLKDRGLDLVALQEVRANDKILRNLVGEGWHIADDECSIKGRAGVALLSKHEFLETRAGLNAEVDTSGRWLEADLEVGGAHLTVVSVYVYSGEVDTPKQEDKWGFLEAMLTRLDELFASGREVLVMGDINIGHREFDIKNWKGNVKRSGFLPRERSYLDRVFGEKGASVECVDGTTGTGLGWVDVVRSLAGDVDGPYSWWSWRGKAFDNDTGWRIDYHFATPGLAATAHDAVVDRAAAYDQRWSDHAPVVVEYRL